MADALKIGHIEAQIATETIIPQIGWNTYLKLSFFPEHKHFMTIQSWFCYFELFRVYSFSPSSGIHCGLLITSLCLKSSQRSWIWPFCSRNISIRFCRNEAIWNTLIQTNKQPNEQVSWWNLGAEGIADKELLLGCHLLVEEPQLLPVEICLPLVSSSYPPGGVEVEDTLRTI